MKKNDEIYKSLKYELRKLAGTKNYTIKLTKELKRLGGTCRYKDKHIVVVNSNLKEKDQIIFIIDELLSRNNEIFHGQKLSANLIQFLNDNNYKIIENTNQQS